MAHEMQMGDDHILRARLWGDLDVRDAMSFSAEFSAKLDAASEDVHCLVDVAGIGKASAGARSGFSDLFRTPHPKVGRTALVGASRYVRVVVGFIIRVTGAAETRLFDSEDSALVWLKEKA